MVLRNIGAQWHWHQFSHNETNEDVVKPSKCNVVWGIRKKKIDTNTWEITRNNAKSHVEYLWLLMHQKP